MTENPAYRAGARILEIARGDPERVALVIDGESWSYAELVAAAHDIARQFPAIFYDKFHTCFNRVLFVEQVSRFFSAFENSF